MIIALIATVFTMYSFAHTTVVQIADYLEINIFTITKKEEKILAEIVQSNE